MVWNAHAMHSAGTWAFGGRHRSGSGASEQSLPQRHWWHWSVTMCHNDSPAKKTEASCGFITWMLEIWTIVKQWIFALDFGRTSWDKQTDRLACLEFGMALVSGCCWSLKTSLRCGQIRQSVVIPRHTKMVMVMSTNARVRGLQPTVVASLRVDKTLLCSSVVWFNQWIPPCHARQWISELLSSFLTWLKHLALCLDKAADTQANDATQETHFSHAS